MNADMYFDERTVAVQRQEIELHDSASILIKLSLRTSKGTVEVDPVKFTLNHPDDGAQAHYGIDSSEITDEEQAICISMAIDLRDGHLVQNELHDGTIQDVSADKQITIKKTLGQSKNNRDDEKTSIAEQSPIKSDKLANKNRQVVQEEEVLSSEVRRVESEPSVSLTPDEKAKADRFAHLGCKEYKTRGACDHLIRVLLYVKNHPNSPEAIEKLSKENLDDFNHKECKEAKQKGSCDHLRQLIVEIQTDPLASSEPVDETEDLLHKLAYFGHRFCRENRRNGSCNHLNEVVDYIKSNPTEKDFADFVEKARLDDYKHDNCAAFEDAGECNHLVKMVYKFRNRCLAEEKSKANEIQLKMQAEEEARKRAQEEAKLKALAKEKQEAEAKAKQEAEAKAKQEAEAKAKQEAEAKAKQEAEAKAKKEAEAKAKQEAEAKAKQEAEAKAKKEAEAKAKQEAEAKAKQEAEAKAKKEAEAKAKQEAEAKAKQEAKAKAKKEAEAKAKQEAEAKAKKDAEEAALNAKKIAEEKARKQSEQEHSQVNETRAKHDTSPMTESFFHVNCQEYKKHGSCAHINDLIARLSKKPPIKEGLKLIKDAQLKDYHHTQCDDFKVRGECDHLEELLESILGGDIEVTDIQVDKHTEGSDLTSYARTSSFTDTNNGELRFEDFVHKNCKEYRKNGACNHMNEIFLFVATKPQMKALYDFLNKANLEDYKHSNCPVYEKDGTCNHLKDIIMSIMAGDIEIADVQVDGKSSMTSGFAMRTDDTSDKSALTDVSQYAHVDCADSKKNGSCDHLAELLKYLKSEPSDELLHKRLDEENLENYQHVNCQEREDTGSCNHLQDMMMGTLCVPSTDYSSAVTKSATSGGESSETEIGSDGKVRRKVYNQKTSKKAAKVGTIDFDKFSKFGRLLDRKKTGPENDEDENELYVDLKHYKKTISKGKSGSETESDAERRKKQGSTSEKAKVPEKKAADWILLNKGSGNDENAIREEAISASNQESVEAVIDDDKWFLVAEGDDESTKKAASDKLKPIEAESIPVNVPKIKHGLPAGREEVPDDGRSRPTLPLVRETEPSTPLDEDEIAKVLVESLEEIPDQQANTDAKPIDKKPIEHRETSPPEIKFLDDLETKRGRDRDVHDFCPKYCKEFDKYGTCMHVDQVALDDYIHKGCEEYKKNNKCGHLKEAMEKMATLPAASDAEIRDTLSNFVHKSGNTNLPNDHLIRIAFRVKARKSPEVKKPKTEREVHDFCPEYCKDFDKYGTCLHVDQINLDEFKHLGCKEYEQNFYCDHLRDVLRDIPDTRKETGDDDLKSILSHFVHKDCHEKDAKGHCNHLIRLALRARARKMQSRKEVEDEMQCHFEECIDFQTTGRCNHVDEKLIKNFSHNDCEEFERKGRCDHLSRLLENIKRQPTHDHAAEIIKALHLDVFEFDGHSSLAKNPHFTDLNAILLRISLQTARPRDMAKKALVCEESCNEFQITGLCEHVDQRLLDNFGHNHCAEFAEKGKCGHLRKLVGDLKAEPTHQDAAQIINALHLNTFPHKAGASAALDSKAGNIVDILMRISYRTPRPKDIRGRAIICPENCSEYVRTSLCEHVDEKLLDNFGHDCDEFMSKGHCRHLGDVVWSLKREPSHGEALMYIQKLDMDQFQPKSITSPNEHKRCARLDKILTRVSERYDRSKRDDLLFLEEVCPKSCSEFMKYGTCGHIDQIPLEEFTHKECKECEDQQGCGHLKEVLGEIANSGPLMTKDKIKELVDDFEHHHCEEFERFGRCSHLIRLATRVKERMVKIRDPNISDGTCAFACDEFKTSGSCSHLDGQMVKAFAHKDCLEYQQYGTCYHLQEMLAHLRNQRFSKSSLKSFHRRMREFYHTGCVTFRRTGTCNHLQEILDRAIARFDKETEVDEWYHRNCDDYYRGNVCKHMLEVRVGEFIHRSCDQARTYGKCFHAYDMLGTWRPAYDGFEYLRRMHPQEYDTFYHEKCDQYSQYGTCKHVDELQFDYFKHEDCDEYRRKGKCNHLRDIVHEVMKNDVLDEKEVEKYFKDVLSHKLKHFVHQGCSTYQKHGQCDHLFDMILEWKWKFDKNLNVNNRNDRQYEPYFHRKCKTYDELGMCPHIDESRFEKFSHRGCLEYGRFGKCNHLRDSTLRWRAKYRDDYNSEARSNRFLRREYHFRTHASDDETSNYKYPRRERRPWDDGEQVQPSRRQYSEDQVDPNLDRYEKISVSFRNLFRRTNEIEDHYHGTVRPKTNQVRHEVKDSAELIREMREKLHDILARQDDMEHHIEELAEEDPREEYYFPEDEAW